VCNRKSLWALAWLTLVVTLVARIATRCRRTVGLDGHRFSTGGSLWKTMFRSSRSQTPGSARTQREGSILAGKVYKPLQSVETDHD